MLTDPCFEDPAGTVVVVTLFRCRTLRQLLGVRRRFAGMAGVVKAKAPALLSSVVSVDYRRRLVMNVSVWPDVESMRQMGDVPEHVLAARYVGRRPDIATASGVFAHAGDWRELLWGVPRPDHGRPSSPTEPDRPSPAIQPFTGPFTGPFTTR